MPHAAQPPSFAPDLFCIAPGQTLSLTLACGTELFCAAGALQLQTSAVGGIDCTPGLLLHLPAGRSWRSPGALHLCITASGVAPARLHCCAAAPARTSTGATLPGWIATALQHWRSLRRPRQLPM